MSNFAAQCDGRLNKLDHVALTSSTKAMQEQLKTFGQDLMAQIIKLRTEPIPPNKIRRGEDGVEDDAEMAPPPPSGPRHSGGCSSLPDHRGGMQCFSDQPYVMQLASQLVAVLASDVDGQNLSAQEPRVSSPSCKKLRFYESVDDKHLQLRDNGAEQDDACDGQALPSHTGAASSWQIPELASCLNASAGPRVAVWEPSLSMRTSPQRVVPHAPVDQPSVLQGHLEAFLGRCTSGTWCGGINSAWTLQQIQLLDLRVLVKSLNHD